MPESFYWFMGVIGVFVLVTMLFSDLDFRIILGFAGVWFGFMFAISLLWKYVFWTFVIVAGISFVGWVMNGGWSTADPDNPNFWK